VKEEVMATKALKTVALSAGLLLATATISAYAIDVSVGGISASALSGGGAPAATVNTGNALGGVTANGSVLGGGGNVATVNVGVPTNNKAHVSIGLGNGPLAKVDSDGNPLNGGNATSGVINLGGFLGGLGIGDIGDVAVDTGPGAPGGAGAILASLSGSQQAKLRANCRTVLGSPGGYSRDVVAICRLLRM
jgi:hypothetical protein